MEETLWLIDCKKDQTGFVDLRKKNDYINRMIT